MPDSPSSTDGAGRLFPQNDVGAGITWLKARIEELESELQAERERTRVLEEALRAIVDRHGDYYPPGSWTWPGHDVIAAEWERAHVALAAVAVEDDGRVEPHEERYRKALAESERLRDTLERADAEIRRLLAIFARLHLLANFLPGPHAQRIHDEIAEALESPKESPKVSPDETLGESALPGGSP